ncbi:hypothetical protein GCM10010442_46520 [Kitasatospora kifunensis]
MQRHDLVGADDGGEPVCDDHHGLAGDQPFDGLLHHHLGLGVQRGGRLVEQHDGGVLEDGPGDRDPLALPAGESGADLADPRVVALREAVDELVHVRGAGGGLDLGVGRLGPGERDVGADGVVEEVDVLEDDGEVPQQFLRFERAHVDTAQAHDP